MQIGLLDFIEYLKANYPNINFNNEDEKIPNGAFYKDGEWQLFLKNRRGEKVPIKKVRIRENLSNTVNLKDGLNQHVNPSNNHHVLIYLDKNDNLREDIVMFWDAVKRKLKNLPLYQLPLDGKEIVTILEINDLFILGLSNEEFESNKDNKAFLNKYLYRVQKISSKYYTFRHICASTIDNPKEEIRIQSMGKFQELNPIKIKIDLLGNIERIIY